MKEYEVTCVQKPHRTSPHERISHIGNQTGQWLLTRESAIFRIESRTEAFYTADKLTGQRTYLRVVREPGKAPYLRTWADGQWSDSLLALAECGVGCVVF